MLQWSLDRRPGVAAALRHIAAQSAAYAVSQQKGGAASDRLVSRLAGIYCVKRVHTSAKVVDCFVPNYKGSKFDPMPWSFTLPPREDPEGNLCVSATPSLTGDAVVWIAPPLRFHTRMTVFHLDEINIIAQTFSADTLCSLRLRGISSASDPALVDRLFAAYGFKDSLVDLLMVVETKSTERWANIERSSTHPGLYDYVLKLKVRSILAESQPELHNFPYDTQDMHIHLTVNMPVERAELFSDDQDPSLMMHKRFQHASICDIVHKQKLVAEISCSNVEESASANIYPRCTFHTTLNRRYSYYVVNVALPLAILTFLAGLSADQCCRCGRPASHDGGPTVYHPDAAADRRRIQVHRLVVVATSLVPDVDGFVRP